MFNSFKVVGLLASLVLVSGCAVEAEGPQAEGEGDAIATATQSLDPDVTRLRTGKCNGDGIMIKDGVTYRLGVATGTDVTGITDPNRSPNGPVCHNKDQWRLAATYICNSNGGGTRNEEIIRYGEYVDNVLIWHPGGPGVNGLYTAYLDVRGPCDTRSKLDYALDTVECCMNPATPVP
jgi:hypothetical protein